MKCNLIHRCVMTIALPFIFFAAHAKEMKVQISVSLVKDSQRVEAIYTLNQATRELRFSADGNVRLLAWKPQEGIQLSVDGNVLLSTEPRTRFVVRIEAFSSDGLLDRVYSPLITFGSGKGVALYTEYLFPKMGGSITVHDESIVLGQKRSSGDEVWQANNPPTYITLGASETVQEEKFSFTFDPSVPVWVKDTLRNRMRKLVALYRTQFQSIWADKIWVMVSFNPNGTGQYRGDTRPGMIRLNLMGNKWQQADMALHRQLDAFLAHELFHVWNAELWQHDPSVPVWALEGSADAIATEALYKIGAIDSTQFRNEKNSSLIQCSNVRGKFFYEKVKANGRVPYICGAALYYLASQLEVNLKSERGILDMWANLFRQTKTSRHYSETQLIENFLPTTLYDEKEKLLSVFNDLINPTKKWNEVLEHNQEVLKIHHPKQSEFSNELITGKLLDNLLAQAILEDCNNEISLYSDDLVYTAEALPSCKQLKQTLRLTKLGGITMKAKPLESVRYALEHCAMNQSIVLGAESGESLTLGCGSWLNTAGKDLFMFDEN